MRLLNPKTIPTSTPKIKRLNFWILATVPGLIGGFYVWSPMFEQYWSGGSSQQNIGSSGSGSETKKD